MSNTPRVTGDGSGIYNGITVNTPYEDAKDQGVKVEDFLQLMIAQLSNQDFMNPADDTQYVTQLAQFATMQSMQELSHYSQTNYVSSLVGKTVTVASLGMGGSVDKQTGMVTSVNLSGDEYTITVNGKTYTLSQIMQIDDTNNKVDQNALDAANKISPIVKNVGANNISIRWDAPVTDEEMARSLRYDVYITGDASLDFDTLTGVKKGEKVGENMSARELDISGLEEGKTYFINIVVRNGNGDEAIYRQMVQTTKS